MYRVGYDFQTRRITGWSHPRAGHCDVVALFAAGYSRTRMASALRKLAVEIERAQDPNEIKNLPTAHYHAAGEPEEITQQPKACRHAAPSIG